jgi:hypothetical protein
MGSCRIAPVARNAGVEAVAWRCFADGHATEASYWHGRTPRMHLAQLNIGRLKAPIDDGVIDDFPIDADARRNGYSPPGACAGA